MNYTQNEKITQVTEKTLVVGIDIGSEGHYARAFDWRGYEFSKKALKFSNTQGGFEELMAWMHHIKDLHGKEIIISGMEPTGHYWFNLGKYLKDNDINPVLVNPHHVKKSKELDDNSPSKNDRKDPKTIAGLVNDGRYSNTCLPEGIYAELRTASNLRIQLTSDSTRVANRIQRWFSIYFPEYKKVFRKFDAESSMILLKQATLPEDIIALGSERINQLWRDVKLRGVGMKRAKAVTEAAELSIGSREGLTAARIEIQMLLAEYESKQESLKKVMDLIEELCEQIPMAKKMLEIKGVGIRTASGFLAEVGDIRRFSNPKQLQKLAGLEITENNSGKHQGKTKISKRGRKRLRYLLFQVALSLVSRNPEFKQLHRYYTTREVNPLKKMQSLIAIACKIIRVFYAILTKGVDYDAAKMLSDIKYPKEYAQAA